MKYVVVGGEAVIFHGHVRFTGGVDFFYRHDPENVAALFQALTAFWGGKIPGIEKPEEFLEPGIIVQFGRPPKRIDQIREHQCHQARAVPAVEFFHTGAMSLGELRFHGGQERSTTGRRGKQKSRSA